jgi:NAD(P)-dependent dehydrogenase (short-subunit alcohol dehydrogenase family)
LYCASKNYKIRCNSLHPGAILTPLWDAMIGTNPIEREKAIKVIAEGIPLGHMGEPIDVAYAFIYLGSDESKYVTGIEINIDGGILAGSMSSPKKYD